jgi:hypothetical protein
MESQEFDTGFSQPHRARARFSPLTFATDSISTDAPDPIFAEKIGDHAARQFTTTPQEMRVSAACA